MNSEIKERWVAALRSGDYKQGKQLLHYNDKFCCLGVLCEVMGYIGVERKDISNEIPKNIDEQVNVIYEYGMCRTAPPSYVIDQSGLREETISILMSMNDNGQKSFNDIADYIEEKL